MPCTPIAGGFVCGPKPRRQRCYFCAEFCVALCDGKKVSGTCDARICETHRHRSGDNLDLCPRCFEKKNDPKPVEQKSLFNG